MQVLLDSNLRVVLLFKLFDLDRMYTMKRVHCRHPVLALFCMQEPESY